MSVHKHRPHQIKVLDFTFKGSAQGQRVDRVVMEWRGTVFHQKLSHGRVTDPRWGVGARRRRALPRLDRLITPIFQISVHRRLCHLTWRPPPPSKLAPPIHKSWIATAVCLYILNQRVNHCIYGPLHLSAN